MEEHGIIATSPTVLATESTLAHRMVIRDWGGEYVVHMQVFEANGAVSFHHGNYLPKKDDGALKRAWEKFEERTRRILDMSSPAPSVQAVADIAESIINDLLPEDAFDRREKIRDDYMLESNLDTFENYTGKSLWIREAEDDEEGE